MHFFIQLVLASHATLPLVAWLNLSQDKLHEATICWPLIWAIPFNVHPPLWTSSIKFEPLRRKDQSADTNTPPPQKLRNFCLTPQKKCKDQRTPMHTTSETAFSNPPVYIKWNSPMYCKCYIWQIRHHNGPFQKRSIPPPHGGNFCCPKGEGGKLS
jgi:hypothetical protein